MTNLELIKLAAKSDCDPRAVWRYWNDPHLRDSPVRRRITKTLQAEGLTHLIRSKTAGAA